MDSKTVIEIVAFAAAVGIVYFAMRRAGVIGVRSSMARKPYGHEFGNGVLLMREWHETRDRRVESAIGENFSLHPDLRAEHISIFGRDGIVTLEGSVSCERERRIAGEIASSVPGVRDVINDLRVERAA